MALGAFHYLEWRDFKNYKKSGREFVTELAVPSIGDFKKYLAERFLEIYGPRKLCSFIQRCNGEGPWQETIVQWKQDKSGDRKKYVYSKLELEFVQLQNLQRAKLPLNESSVKRYQDLLEFMSPNLMAKSDNELLKIAKEWISNIKDSVDTAAQE